MNALPNSTLDVLPEDAVAAIGIDAVPDHADPLAEALHYLRMDGMFYCRSELSAPWGIDLPPMPDCMWFHVVTNGNCTLVDPEDDSHALRQGDIAVLPHGGGHRIFDHPDTATPLVFDLPHHYISRHYAILRHGDGGEPCTVICGVVHLGHPAARMLLSVLPEIIHVDAAIGRDRWEWLPGMLALVATEAETAQPGGETVITRLCDILVIQAIRSWIDNDPAAENGWLQALRDPLIGRALTLVHRDPSRHWTVTSLASDVGMSRSTLSAKFTDLIGVSPKQYITTWRMQIAESTLGDTDQSIAEIAASLGYQSEAAFSRAFKRETGIAPSHVRKQPDLMARAQEQVEG